MYNIKKYNQNLKPPFTPEGRRTRASGAQFEWQVSRQTGPGDQLVSDYEYMYCRRWGDVQVRVAPLELRRFNT